MTKKNKIVDLKTTPEKVTDEQLAELQTMVKKIQTLQNSLSQAEYQKYQYCMAIDRIQNELSLYNQTLTNAYGNVSIDIANGDIKEIENESDPKN